MDWVLEILENISINISCRKSSLFSAFKKTLQEVDNNSLGFVIFIGKWGVFISHKHVLQR